ncbi:MAG: hypothetical protein Q8J79_01595 [Erythrobacter sp.]|nr:hypothetical protein [Erythrobacter sp.]
MRARVIIFSGLLLLLLQAGCNSNQQETQASAEELRPNTAEADPVESPVSNGKPCSDSDQCEGFCFTEQVDLPSGTETQGMCSESVFQRGKGIKGVEDGKIVDGPPKIVM